MVKDDDQLEEFVKSFDVPPPLQIREALYDGITEPICLITTATMMKKLNLLK